MPAPIPAVEENVSVPDADTCDSDWLFDLVDFLGTTFGVCTISGIRLRIHPSFLIGVAAHLWFYWDCDGVRGLFFGAFIIGVSTISIILHEFGHAWMARRFRIAATRIVVFFGGAFVRLEEIPRNSRIEFLIAVAGPAVNFGIALLMYSANEWIMDWYPPRWGLDPSDFVDVIILINLFIGCCNLLPIFPMDGGRALRALLARGMTYGRATLVAVSVGKAIGFALLGYVIFETSHDLFLILHAGVLLLILLAGELEYRSVKDDSVSDA
jgi:Zn-dependent protease